MRKLIASLSIMNVSAFRVAFVSGHMDLTQQEFDKYYKPALDALLADGVRRFVMGGADGTDKLAQSYLVTRKDVSVTVFDKGAQNNVHFPQVNHRNGFATYTLRDEALTRASTEDVAFVRAVGGLGSGTFQNVLRRSLLTQEDTQQVTDAVRSVGLKATPIEAGTAVEEALGIDMANLVTILASRLWIE